MFIIGEKYTKHDLYQILDVPVNQRRGAWDTGYRKYKNNIFLFANIGVAGRTGHNYDNHWDGSDLIWYGKTASTFNQPLIQEMIFGNNKVYIFTRTDDRSPFTYNGEGKVKHFEDIQPVKLIWEFKTLGKHINISESWQIILKNAKTLYYSQDIFVSPINHHRYKIIKVTNEYIKIKRISIPSETEVDLTYNIFEIAISKMNQNSGILTRKQLYNSVIIEATIVQLLPILDWDDDFKNVIILNKDDLSLLTPPIKKVKEAVNDLELKTITRMLRIRRGQNKLRENLLYLYQGKCCITQNNVKDVLHACHIIPHAESGLNSTTNALLLRSDIHDLFDSNLIAINPKNFEVKTNKILRHSEYQILNGIKTCKRIDGITPDINALNYKWDIFNTLL